MLGWDKCKAWAESSTDLCAWHSRCAVVRCGQQSCTVQCGDSTSSQVLGWNMLPVIIDDMLMTDGGQGA